MANPFYNPSGSPAPHQDGLSAVMRNEFAAIAAGFDKVPRFLTTGLYDTVFAQLGSFTFTLPAAPGTLALLDDVAVETARAEAVEATNAGAIATETARAEAVEAAETARALAAEVLLAPRASPALTGTPTAPTAAPFTNTTQIATTAFVLAQQSAIVSGVASVAGRAGNVTLTIADVSGAISAASPDFTGTPTAPTASPGTNSTQLATTAFTAAAVAVETSRAQGVEATNASAIAAETSRAEAAENGKQNTLGFTPYNATNPAGYQTAAQVTTALGPYATTASLSNVVRNPWGGNAVYLGFLSGALVAQIDGTYFGQVPTAGYPGNFVRAGDSVTFASLAATSGLIVQGGGIAVSGSQSQTRSGWYLTAGGTNSFNGTYNVAVDASGLAMEAAWFLSVSDGRLKSDRVEISDEEGERFVRGCPAYRYVKSGAAECGFIAQDIVAAGFGETIGAVADESTPREGFGYGGPEGAHLVLPDKTPVAYLAAALRLALSRIDTLSADLASLRKQVEAA